MRALKACDVAALKKGGVAPRPLLLSCILRCNVLKGPACALRGAVGEAVGPLQFEVGASGGAEATILGVGWRPAERALGPLHCTPQRSAEYQTVSRPQAFDAARRYLASEPFLRTWYAEGATHRWRDQSGEGHTRGRWRRWPSHWPRETCWRPSSATCES